MSSWLSTIHVVWSTIENLQKVVQWINSDGIYCYMKLDYVQPYHHSPKVNTKLRTDKGWNWREAHLFWISMSDKKKQNKIHPSHVRLCSGNIHTQELLVDCVEFTQHVDKWNALSDIFRLELIDAVACGKLKGGYSRIWSLLFYINSPFQMSWIPSRPLRECLFTSNGHPPESSSIVSEPFSSDEMT